MTRQKIALLLVSFFIVIATGMGFFLQQRPNTQPVLPTLAQLPAASSVPVEVNQQQPALPDDINSASLKPAANDIIDMVEYDTTSNSAPPQVSPDAPVAHAGHLVIEFAPGATDREQEAYLKHAGLRVVETLPELNTVIVEGASTGISLADSPLIVQTELDYYVRSLVNVPTTDPEYARQWSLEPMGVPAAWMALPTDVLQITVAVIDSGVCASHPDLAGKILAGYDFVQKDSTPQDEYGHGCAVTGIIAAGVDNGIGIAGVAPNAHILPLRVLDSHGVGLYSDV